MMLFGSVGSGEIPDPESGIAPVVVETEVVMIPRRGLDCIGMAWHAFAERFGKLSGTADVKDEEEE